MQKKLECMSDEELIKKVREEDELAKEVLVKRYMPLVKRSIRFYFLADGEEDDLLQEAYIGFIKAMDTYNEEKNDAFFPFAKLCVQNQIKTAVTASNRKKHLPLNTSVPIETADKQEMHSLDGNPEDIVLEKEKNEDRSQKIYEKLTKLEQNVLVLYLDGFSYEQIASKIGKNKKSIDNAIQRIKKKLVEQNQSLAEGKEE